MADRKLKAAADFADLVCGRGALHNPRQLGVKGGPLLIADTAAMRPRPDPHGAISGPDALTCRGTGAARNVADDDGRLGHLAILLTTATIIRIINVAIVYFRMYAG